MRREPPPVAGRSGPMYRAALTALALLSTAAAAAQDKPVTQREPGAVDVIATPATDLNLKKDEIPPILLAAQSAPYGLAGMRRCTDLTAEITRLDAALGDDFDVAQETGRKISPGKVAQSVVGSFIPFRGLIREVSGANEQQRKLQLAIYSGSARRAFLKGVGLQRGCPWPARPATSEVLARIADENAAKAQRDDKQPRR